MSRPVLQPRMSVSTAAKGVALDCGVKLGVPAVGGMVRAGVMAVVGVQALAVVVLVIVKGGGSIRGVAVKIRGVGVGKGVAGM